LLQRRTIEAHDVVQLCERVLTVTKLLVKDDRKN